MNDFLRPLSASELRGHAQAGNAFSRIEHARAVAQSRSGAEVIVRAGEYYQLALPPEGVQLSQLAQGEATALEFIDANRQVLNLNNSEGIRGIGERISAAELRGKASAGNAFSRFTHAESVARQLGQDVAIVADKGLYRLYHLSADSSERLLQGKNDLLDARVSAVVRGGKTLYNWGAERVTDTATPGFVQAVRGRLMRDGQPYTIRGLNVYDLVNVAQQGDAELRQTLQLIADSGINSVRMLTLSAHALDDVRKVLDTSREMGLDLTFIPVLGNHWQHCEAAHSAFVKQDDWYQQGFETHYWPHARQLVEGLMDRPEILMWELMNEPEASHEVLRGFADEISTRIRALYDQREAETGQPLPRHLIGLGTLGVGRSGDERPGMRGHDYKDLYGLPHLDVATVHDYTADTLEGSIANFMRYARELNKPFFLGEIGVKVREGGTEQKPEHSWWGTPNPQQAQSKALNRLKEKLKASAAAGSSGAMLWGPQPRGHAVDGDGYGFSYDHNSPAFERIREVMQNW